MIVHVLVDNIKCHMTYTDLKTVYLTLNTYGAISFRTHYTTVTNDLEGVFKLSEIPNVISDDYSYKDSAEEALKAPLWLRFRIFVTTPKKLRWFA